MVHTLDHCVYFHYRRSNGKLFYIGMGTNGRPYDFQHRSVLWKRVKDKHGIRVKIIASKLSRLDASNLEVKMISLHKPLCNFAPGGTGGDTWSTQSPERKEAIRLKQRLAQSESKHSQYGKRKSEEIKQKISQSKLGTQSFNSQIVICIENGIEYPSISKATKDLNLSRFNISEVCKNIRPN
jgi:hypothetical protein